MGEVTAREAVFTTAARRVEEGPRDAVFTTAARWGEVTPRGAVFTTAARWGEVTPRGAVFTTAARRVEEGRATRSRPAEREAGLAEPRDAGRDPSSWGEHSGGQ